jgi:hypothetical protein
VGLFRNFGHPEIIIFGLDLILMHKMINGIGEAIREGVASSHGVLASGFLQGYDVRFVDFPRSAYRDHLGYANWFYKGQGSPALQCLWPDKAGRFPGFHSVLREQQPLFAEKL